MLFVCCWLYGALIIARSRRSRRIASIGKMIDELWIGKDLETSYGIYLEGLRKATENLSQDSRCPGLDSNQAPSKFKSEVLGPPGFSTAGPWHQLYQALVLYEWKRIYRAAVWQRLRTSVRCCCTLSSAHAVLLVVLLLVFECYLCCYKEGLTRFASSIRDGLPERGCCSYLRGD
jgi:hypothetical protein